MKQLFRCIATLLLLSVTHQSCLQSKAKTSEKALIARADTIGKSAEWQQIEALHQQYMAILSKDSSDDKVAIKLIELYLNESRITGNGSHYNALAMVLINKLIANKNTSSDNLYLALSYKATVLLSSHQFAQAKEIALKALGINTFEADIFGSLIDADIELGNYDEAVKNCDKMLAIRPDLRSYSRASYLREIYGDHQGAIGAMQMAVDAGAAGFENTEWARVQLGDLYLEKNAIDTARLMYQRALAFRPNYVHALIGLAKIDEVSGKNDSAISKTENAINIISESSFISYLAHLKFLNKNNTEADVINKNVVELLEEAEQENKKETLIPHNGNREMAQAYLANNQLDKAFSFAKQDYDMRPKNIDANALLAEICLKANRIDEAKTYADKALSTKRKSKKCLTIFATIYKLSNQQDKVISVKQMIESI
jgi:tetratricopeptide (TPR) repeat protein